MRIVSALKITPRKVKNAFCVKNGFWHFCEYFLSPNEYLWSTVVELSGSVNAKSVYKVCTHFFFVSQKVGRKSETRFA